jgi:hypothetical protein
MGFDPLMGCVVADAGGVSVIGSGRVAENVVGVGEWAGAVSKGIKLVLSLDVLVKCIISNIIGERQGEKLGY